MTDSWGDVTPTLVATDIDGTIVPIGGTVSARTRATLHECIAAGVDVVLVTGRPPRWLPPVIEATGLSTTAICANGAIVVDTDTYEPISVSTISAESAARAVARLQRAVPGAVFAAESPTQLRAGPGYERTRTTGRHAEGLAPAERLVTATSSIEQMLDDDQIFKIVVVCPESGADELLKVTRTAVGDLVSVTRSAVGQSLIELGPRGVTKASTLAAYAAGRGVDAAQVMAFGDMPNDVEMLRWAGRGYAMAGAHPEAVAAARFSAPPAEDDGVAQVLEQMLSRRLAA